MGKSTPYAALLIVFIMSCSNRLVAQNKDSNLIPESVRTAQATKYPKAEVKRWDTVKNEYVAKIKENGHRHLVSFDHDAHWVKTETKLNWPWHLPKAVKSAFHKSIYKNWNMFGVRVIDTPSGLYYQILADDRNHPVDIFHQGQLTRYRTVAFKSDGEVIDAGYPEDKGVL